MHVRLALLRRSLECKAYRDLRELTGCSVQFRYCLRFQFEFLQIFWFWKSMLKYGPLFPSVSVLLYVMLTFFFSFLNKKFSICISFSSWNKKKPSVLKLKLKVFIKFEIEHKAFWILVCFNLLFLVFSQYKNKTIFQNSLIFNTFNELIFVLYKLKA